MVSSNSAPARGGSRSILIIVGVLALLGLAYSLARVDILRARLVNVQMDFKTLQANHNTLQGQLAALRESAQDSERQLAELHASLGALNESVGALRVAPEQVQLQALRIEALYLLRLAQQQLNLGHDATAALDSLNAAGILLRQSSNSAVSGIAAQVQTAQQQLQAVPQMTATIEQGFLTAEQEINALTAVATTAPTPEAVTANGWQRAWQMLKRGLSRLFVVQQHGPAALDVDALILQQRYLQLLLLNARVAYRLQDQQGYQSALSESQQWLQPFAGEPHIDNLRAQLHTLSQQDVGVPKVELTTIIQALNRQLPTSLTPATVSP